MNKNRSLLVIDAERDAIAAALSSSSTAYADPVLSDDEWSAIGAALVNSENPEDLRLALRLPACPPSKLLARWVPEVATVH